MFEVDQIRMEKSLLMAVYNIRKEVFVNEWGFDKYARGGMIQNIYDALSTHHLLIHDGKPTGSVAVIDLTEMNDELQEYGIPLEISVAKVTKLAILPEDRFSTGLRNLQRSITEEVVNFDYIFAEVFLFPTDKYANARAERLAKHYKRLGLTEETRRNVNGLPSIILSKNNSK